MFERFTKPAREVVVAAQEEARGLGHAWVGTEHLLLAVLRRPQDPGAATLARLGVTAETCRHAVTTLVVRDADTLDAQDAEALKTFGIDLEEIRRRTDATFGKGALDGPADPGEERPRRLLPFARGRRGRGRTPSVDGHIPFTPRAKKALELSLREAIAVKDRHIGVEHLVLALLRSDDRLTRALLDHLGVEPGPVRDVVLADLHRAA
jgi:ATP-dependent Clp protease ATP-binding subunit ClpA